MRKLILATLMSVGICSTAVAQALPDLGHMYLTGTTDELYIMRAAMTKYMCTESDPTYSSCGEYGETTWSYPFVTTIPPRENIDWQLFEPPLGLGAVDCMAVPTTLDVFDGGAVIDGAYVPTPPQSALLQQNELPDECHEHLVLTHCGTPDVWWWFCHDFGAVPADCGPPEWQATSCAFFPEECCGQ